VTDRLSADRPRDLDPSPSSSSSSSSNAIQSPHATQSLRSVHDVVFTFSYETWTDAVRRGMMRPPERLLGTLLEHPRVGRVLVANPYRSALTDLARRATRSDAAFPTTDEHTLHRPLRWRRRDPVEVGELERQYRRYGRSLEQGARRQRLTAPDVVTTNPLVAGFADLGWANSVTYFGRDDWSSSPAREEYWPAYREAYARMSRAGTAVAAVSQEILDRIRPTGPHAVVPNGVDAGEWSGPKPRPPAWFAAIDRPRAVYVGTLDSRLDIEGLAHVAQQHPHLSIVLIGPLPDPAYVAPLERFGNVHVHPPVGREEIVAVLRNSELALLAHRRTPLTEAMSPLKVYEYLAAGVPVLAVDLPPVRGLGSRVRLAPTVHDFAAAVPPALGHGPQAEDERLAWVAENSWPSRHEAVLRLAVTANVSD
jgi:glycosyltransferase involved in cell wall biosynthesis